MHVQIASSISRALFLIGVVGELQTVMSVPGEETLRPPNETPKVMSTGDKRVFSALIMYESESGLHSPLLMQLSFSLQEYRALTIVYG